MTGPSTSGVYAATPKNNDLPGQHRPPNISSRGLSAAAFADAKRGHWCIENNLHHLSVTFSGDRPRLGDGGGARNMARGPPLRPQSARQLADSRSYKAPPSKR